MANRVTMSICGEEYTLVAEESAAYMEKVGALVDKKMAELMDAAHMGRLDAAVLTAVNIADELYKAQESAENLRRQLKNLIKCEDNLANSIGYFVVGAILLASGAMTGMAFLGLVGGGCIILGLERLVRRSAAKQGGTMSDLRADEERNRGNK